MGRPVTFKRLFLHSIFNASFLCWLSCRSLITWVWVQLVGCRAWLFTLNLSTPFAGHCSAGGLIWRFIFASRSGALRSCYHYHSHSGLADDSPVRWRFAESVPVEPTAAGNWGDCLLANIWGGFHVCRSTLFIIPIYIYTITYYV